MQRTIRQQSMTILLALSVSAALWYSGEIGRWVLATLMVMIVPGWWWQRMLPLTDVHRVGRWMMQICIGPALVIILYVWAAWLDVRVPVMALWIGIGVLAVGMLWQMPVQRWSPDTYTSPWYITIACVVGLIGMSRWLHIDGLVLPPWVDGVHHTLLVRVAVEQSHAAWDLMPYLPINPLLYHTGWHSVMAFVWVMAPSSFIELGWFLLIVGQWLNVLAVVSVAGFVWYWWRSLSATVIALILIGLVLIMPAYYLSWGRYTLLAGMAWLPVVLIALDVMWTHDAPQRVVWVGLLLAGLLLTHFVVGVMALVWGMVLWVSYGRPPHGWVIVAGVVLVCMLPWWSVFMTQVVWASVGDGVGDASARVVIGNSSQNAFVPELFWARHHVWFVPLSLVSAWWLIHNRQVRSAQVVVWWTLVIVLANPVVFGVPYLSFFTNEIWITAMYVPMSVLISRMGAYWRQRWMRVALILVAVLAFASMQRIVRSATILTNQADMAAIAWIDAELPADTVFLTNVTEWMWQVDRGVDGGWWVMPLTGRATTTPPVLFTYADGDVAQALYAQTEQVRQIRTVDALDAWLQENPAITHVYATERGVISPQMVAALPYVTNVYATGDVAIYAVQP
ncbi:MAG: hypothetical protein ACO3F2_08415 [Roseiflexaceae bacterium]